MLESGFVAFVHDPSRAVEPSFELPFVETIDHTAPSYSEFAQRLFTTPALELEPQFILEGRHYRVDRQGPTLGISTEVDDGLTTLSLILRLDRRSDQRLPTALLWHTSGTASHSYEDDRQLKWSELGVSPSLYYPPVSVQMDVEVLSEHLDEAWPWIPEWLTAPRPAGSPRSSTSCLSACSGP